MIPRRAEPPRQLVFALLFIAPTVSCAGAKRSDSKAIVVPRATSSPLPAGSASTATPASGSLLVAGEATTCVRKPDRSIWCWGSNGDGQFRDGTTKERLRPERLPRGETFVQIAIGGSHMCALREDRTVECWGHNLYGQAGPGDPKRASGVTQIAGLTDVEQLALGNFHSCARRRDATVWCWGFNETGELGDGSTTSRTAPVQVLGLADAVDVRVGGYHNCARRRDGSVSCWGNNGHGQCGVGERVRAVTEPREVSPTNGRIVQLSLGGFTTCARMNDGTAQCWGEIGDGGFGLGTEAPRYQPAPLGDVSDVAEVAVGGYESACALRIDGSVWCWGRFTGQIVGLERISEVALGHGHACALRRDGAVLCWGINLEGQLGDGTTDSRATPVVTIPP